MIVNKDALLKAAPIKDMVINKVQAQPTSWGLTECGYDIRLKQEIVFYPTNYEHLRTISRHEGFIPPSYSFGQEADRTYGNFCLGSSVEEFQMPTNLMGRVLNKSTWARKGLDASMTTNIEPGWNGFLTLELTYHGQEVLIIPAGSGICQIIFETLAEPAQYVGKYQNQEDKPVEAKLTSDSWTQAGEDWLRQGAKPIEQYQPDPTQRGFTPK